MKEIDSINCVAEVIEGAAKRFYQGALALEKIASDLRETKDIRVVSQVPTEMLNVLQNSRIDLVLTRSINAIKNND